MKKIKECCHYWATKLKFDLKTRLTVLLVVFSLCRIDASIYSQNTKLSLNSNNVTFEELFKKIKENSDFKVFFKNSEINPHKKVSVNIANKGIEYILDEIFLDSDIAYRIVDKQIVLYKKSKRYLMAVQDKFEIKGQVVDEKNIPILGVTIIIKGANKGTVTDFYGRFSIMVSKSDVLIIESLGYKTKEVSIGEQKQLSIILEERIEELEEVIVGDGYKKVDKVHFTGVATRLELEDIKIDGISDPSRLLEGRDAGVVVDNLSGSFGASPRIRIRGNTSINGNNNPIWVVDGVILEDNVELDPNDLASGDINSLIGSSIAGINPDDIDSFSILKDASATALYGARAKNGVIVITTKQGKKGKLRVTANTSYAYRLLPNYETFNVLNSQQELSIYSELVRKGLVDLTSSQGAKTYGVLGKYYALRAINNIEIGANGQLSNAFFNRYQMANTDWFNVLFKDLSFIQNHSVNISGGSDNAIYYFSLSYLNDEGQTIGDVAKRYTVRLNTKFKLSNKLSISTSIVGSVRDQGTPGTNNRELDPITGKFLREFDINPYNYSLTNSRSVTAYDENGNLEFFRKNYAPFNIVHELKNNYINIDVLDMTFQTDLDYKIEDNLKFSSTFNYRKVITQREHIIGGDSNQAEAFRVDNGILADLNPFLYQDRDNLRKAAYSILTEGGMNIYNEDVLDYAYWRNFISWNPVLNEENEFSFLLGYEIKSSERQNREYNGIGISYKNGYLVNTNPDAIDQLIDGNKQYFGIGNFRDRFFGAFFNTGYTLNNKYTLTGTLRYDGSNLQGSSIKARFLTNYNVSGSWNIDRENFMDLNWIDVLKLKATYGLSGGRGPANASAALNLKGNVSIRPQDIESIIEIRALENNNLTFEKLKEFSVGLEYAFLRHRISGELGYYKRNSFDLIGAVRTSGVGGINEKIGNYADMKVDGYEFALSTVNIKTDKFKWTTNLNIGYNSEKIKELKTPPRLIDLISPSGNPYTGREISALFSMRFAGLNEFGIPTFFDAKNERITNINLQQTEDIEKILKYEGPTQPRGAGGLSNTFSYGALSLTANISFKFDYKIRLNKGFKSGYNDFNSLPKELINRWSLPGDEDITDIPAILGAKISNFELSGGNAYQLYNASDVWVADGTYARLRSIALAYKLPNKFVGKLGIASAKVRIQGENLFLLYSDNKLKGQDPEFFNSGGVALPLAKTVTIAINIGF